MLASEDQCVPKASESILGFPQMAQCLVECKHPPLVFSSVTETFKGRSTKGSSCHRLPGLAGVTLYACLCHCIPDGGEWDGGKWQLEGPPTSIFPALPRDPSKCLQAKEEGLVDTQIWGPQWNGDKGKLCTDHRLRQQPGIGTWLRKWTAEQFKFKRKALT